MSRRQSGITFLLVVLIAASCTTVGGSKGGESFSAPAPPDEDASGLIIGFVPDGYDFVWNEGHETATFHVFQTEDGSGQLSVGVQLFPPAGDSARSERVIRGGREFEIHGEGDRIRVTENVVGGARVDVVGDSLDVATLLRVAESVVYEPIGS